MRISLAFLISVSIVSLFVASFLAAGAGADVATSHRQDVADQDAKIVKLIAQLGSDRYVQRRRAQLELGQLGARAFDALHKASSHADPEIATAAGYLLAAIPIHWSDADDSKQVRNFLSNYGSLDTERRLVAIQTLAYLPLKEGLAPLCRIVRFDASEALSRTAAVAILRPQNRSDSRQEIAQEIDPAVLRKLLGESNRLGTDWLRLYAQQLTDPASTTGEWEQFVDAEVQLAGQMDNSTIAGRETGRDNGTSDIVVVNLLWHLLGLYQQLDLAEPALETAARLLDYDPSQFETTIIELIDWFAEAESWAKLDELLSQHQEQIAKTRRPQYVAAIARQKQGQDDVADQLADAALVFPIIDRRQFFRDTQFLVKRERCEWANREYRKAIDNEPFDSQTAICSRTQLALLLNDLDENGDAAAMLEPIESKINQDTKFRRLYNALREQHNRDASLPNLLSPKELSAYRHFYLAHDFRQKQDLENQRKHLKKSIELEPGNADVLIAMYRAKGTDDAWQADVRKRIVDLSTLFQQVIEKYPNEAQWYNQWAWLISNTEGDYQKAIRYSHRSLELKPNGSNAAGYLDTLGRCYFAAGDLENAVKYQRQAVEQDGSLQVLRRQLAMFEKAMFEKALKK